MAEPSPFPSPSPRRAPQSPSSARPSCNRATAPSISPTRMTSPSTSNSSSRSSRPHPFPRTGKLEIANADDTLHTTLTVASGNLILQNPHTLLATLDPLKPSAPPPSGPSASAPISPDGTPGDWLPLVTLVRLPTLKDLRCPPDVTQPCTLSGCALYLSTPSPPTPPSPTPPPSPRASSATPSPSPAQPIRRPASTSAYATTPPPPTR